MSTHIYPNFIASDEAKALGIKGAFIVMEELTNKNYDISFEIFKNEYVRDVASRTIPKDLDSDPILAGFWDLHRMIGKTSKLYTASPHSLLVHLVQKGTLPHINLLVDIYNLISIKTKLSLGMHDVDRITGDVHLGLVTGQERFEPIGYGTTSAITKGEYAYFDDAGDILCRLEVRQSEKTKITLETTRGFYVIHGNQNTTNAQIQAAIQELITLTTIFCGGRVVKIYYL